jgi:hypothetical protein
MKKFQITNNSIGTASLDEDGTLKLALHKSIDTRFNFGTVLIIKPDNPRYQAYLNHIGDIYPGEQRPIPPWDV